MPSCYLLASLATAPVLAPIPGGGSEGKKGLRTQGQLAAQPLFRGTTCIGRTAFNVPAVVVQGILGHL